MVETPLLFSVQRIIRRIQVQHQLLRFPASHPNELLHQKRFDRGFIHRRLAIFILRHRGQLQTIQRALARTRLASIRFRSPIPPQGIFLADQHRHQRICPEFLMIVDILIA